MKRLLIAAILAAGVAVSVAQDDPFKTGEALQAEVSAKCSEGCVVFSREDAADLDERLTKIVNRRVMEAFKAGMEAQKAACASLI